MIIVGIDYSMSSPGLVKCELDDNLDIIRSDYAGYSSVLKTSKLDSNITHFKKEMFNNNLDRFLKLSQLSIDFINSWGTPDYVAIEDYAMGSNSGMNFTIGEATMAMKTLVYNSGSKFRLYSPSAIKKFATGKGNAKKFDMKDAYDKLDHQSVGYFDLSHLPENKNPSEDIIDAYWIMTLLKTELKIRAGLISLKDLNLKQIEVFNSVTKGNPENLLTRDFLTKEHDEFK